MESNPLLMKYYELLRIAKHASDELADFALISNNQESVNHWNKLNKEEFEAQRDLILFVSVNAEVLEEQIEILCTPIVVKESL